MKLKLFLAAVACSILGAMAFAQVTPSGVSNYVANIYKTLTSPNGSVVTFTSPNVTTPARPNNSLGGVTNMPPTTAFWVNYSALMKPLTGYSTLRIESENNSSGPVVTNEGGDFRILCFTSHMGRFDPIIFPGRAVAGHLHTFFGNSDLNGTLNEVTLGNLANFGTSSCEGGIANRSAYWVPALINTLNGQPMVPSINNVYYKNGAAFRASNPTVVQAPVPGLRMIAGNPARTTEDTSGTIRWACYTGVIVPQGDVESANMGTGGMTTHIPTAADMAMDPNSCSDYDDLVELITFPQCWDGVHLDSPDHQSHMAYQNFYTGCPSDHPIPIPEISYNIHWSIKSLGGKANIPNFRLASDNYPMSGTTGGWSGHGDWINGWNQEIMGAIVNNCLHTHTDCHDGILDSYTTMPYRLMY